MGLKVDGSPEGQKAVEQRTGVLEDNFKLVKATGDETSRRVDTAVANLQSHIDHISNEVGELKEENAKLKDYVMEHIRI